MESAEPRPYSLSHYFGLVLEARPRARVFCRLSILRFLPAALFKFFACDNRLNAQELNQAIRSLVQRLPDRENSALKRAFTVARKNNWEQTHRELENLLHLAQQAEKSLSDSRKAQYESKENSAKGDYSGQKF